MPAPRATIVDLHEEDDGRVYVTASYRGESWVYSFDREDKSDCDLRRTARLWAEEDWWDEYGDEYDEDSDY